MLELLEKEDLSNKTYSYHMMSMKITLASPTLLQYNCNTSPPPYTHTHKEEPGAGDNKVLGEITLGMRTCFIQTSVRKSGDFHYGDLGESREEGEEFKFYRADNILFYCLLF